MGDVRLTQSTIRNPAAGPEEGPMNYNFTDRVRIILTRAAAVPPTERQRD